MIGEAGIGIGGELGDQGRIVVRRDRGRRAGGVASSEIARHSPLMQIAFDGAQTDDEATRGLGLAQAVINDALDDAGTEIGRISSHLPSKPSRRSLCKPR